MENIAVNLGYILMLAAFVVHDILWLRVILISAQLSLVSFGLMTGTMPVVFWNTLFVLINSIQVTRLIRERRPIELPSDMIDLYEKYFKVMRRREFLYFWNMGTIHKVTDTLLIKQGEHQKDIALILSGLVEIVKDGKHITDLTRGSFIAEMSFLTGKPASANVFANGTVRYISWNQKKLRDSEKLNPQLLIKIQTVLAKDLAGKVKIASKNN
ncbi:cyclic nucleotide-binding domain-containing protein [Calditrichota bacterium]